jgi:hypothetical protein
MRIYFQSVDVTQSTDSIDVCRVDGHFAPKPGTDYKLCHKSRFFICVADAISTIQLVSRDEYYMYLVFFHARHC